MESLDVNVVFSALASVIALALFISIYYLQPWTSKSKTTKKPPEPAGAWPVIGHLPLLPPHVRLHREFGAMADKYGPIFMIRLGTRRLVILNNSSLAEECLTTKDQALASRPDTAASRYMGYNNTSIGIAPYGPLWREMRKIATVELLSGHRLQILKHIRVSEINTAIYDLYEKYKVNNNDAQGLSEPVLVDMKKWLEDLIMNVVVRMIATKRPSVSTDEESRRWRKVICDLMYLTGIIVASDALPMLKWFDLKGTISKMKNTSKDFDGILSKWLEEHRHRRGNPTEHGEDFMDVMLSKVDDSNPHLCGFDDTAIKSTCLALVVAGNDTTGVTLTWAISLLLNHRHVLKKARAELDSQVGRDRQVDESDIMNLVYLQAIIKETLRLYPAAPTALPHQAMEDCTIGGFDIPAGTSVIINIWKIQRDPNEWYNPEEFQPERFLTAHADVDFRGQHFKLIPFSSGRRKCPGIQFAFHVLHLTLARFIHGFEFETLTGEPMDMREGVGVTLPKVTPLEVLITPRLPSTVYENVERMN